jgi:hypothetical protein
MDGIITSMALADALRTVVVVAGMDAEIGVVT